MRHAASIADLAGSTPQVVYTETDGTWNHDMWAPSYFDLDDHWYIYVAGDDGDIGNHRMRVLESDGLVSQGTTPAGSYHYRSTLQDPATTGFAIDGSPFEHDGQLYFVWAGAYCCGFDTLRIAPMSNPYTISAGGHELGTPTCDGVAEAPATLHRNGRTFLTFSECDTDGPDYHLTLWSLNDGDDPLVNANWQDHGTVFSRNDAAGVYSVGSNGFFTSPDGTQDWIVYQAKDTAADDPSTDAVRTTRAQQFTWNADGTPNFGSPVGLGTDLAVPSGDPDSVGNGTATGPIAAPGGKCIDVAGDDTGSDGTVVQMWDCLSNAVDQHWSVNPDGTLRTLGRCLDIDGDGTANFTHVELWDCNGVGGQQWIPQPNGSLLNPQSGRCLDDPSGNTANGTRLQIYDCNNQWPQVFTLP